MKSATCEIVIKDREYIDIFCSVIDTKGSLKNFARKITNENQNIEDDFDKTLDEMLRFMKDASRVNQPHVSAHVSGGLFAHYSNASSYQSLSSFLDLAIDEVVPLDNLAVFEKTESTRKLSLNYDAEYLNNTDREELIRTVKEHVLQLFTPERSCYRIP